MNSSELIAVDTNALPWEERFNEKLGRALYRKNLVIDPETGMEVRLVRYPAGVINVSHTHPCAHGMFVLQGTLVKPPARPQTSSRVEASIRSAQSFSRASELWPG